MQAIGERLREARMRQGLDITEADLPRVLAALDEPVGAAADSA